MAHPRHPLRTVIKGSRHAHRAGEIVVPVYPLGWLRHALRIRNTQGRMFLVHVERQAVRSDIEPAPTLRVGNTHGWGHRPFHHPREFLADLYVVVVTRLRAATFFLPL